MRDFAQLALTGTADVAGVIPEVWGKLVEKAAVPKRVFRSYIRTDISLLNKAGDVVHIPRRGTVTSDDIAEAGTIVPQTLNYSTALTLTPSEHGCSVAITQQALERGLVNLLVDSTEELSSALAQEEDTDIAAALSAATSNTLFGGDATSTADVALGDKLSPELIAEGIKEVRKNNFEPDVIVIAPEQEWELGTMPQFLSAAQYGSRDYIETGKIASYLGIDIRTSTNVPSGTGGTGTDVPYHTCILMDSKRAGAIAVKRNPQIAREYKPLERVHNIVCTMDRDQNILNDSAICTIVCSDS